MTTKPNPIHPIVMSDSEALQKVSDDIIVLLTKEPFYAYLLVKMTKVIDRRVPVAGVSVINGEIKLYINPEGYLNYTKPERLFILKHEVLHIIYIHYLRRRDRDPSLFNVAADIAINQLIEAPHCQFPADALRIDSWKKDKGFVLPEKENAEVYYQLLWNRGEKIDIPQDLLNSIVGRHLQSSSCDNCGGTGHEPKPKTFKGIIDEIDHRTGVFEVDGKIIHATDETEVSHEAKDPFTFDDLMKGSLVTVVGKEFGGYKFEASSIAATHLKGKISSLDVANNKMNVGDYLVQCDDDTPIFNADGEEIKLSDLADDTSVIVEEVFNKKTKEGYLFDALKVTISNEEDNEDEQDQDQDQSGGGSGEGEQPCSCCGGSGKDPGSGSGEGSGGGRAPGFEGLHPTWEDSTDISEQLAESIVRSMVSEAVQKSRGNVPGAIKQIIDEIMESKVNWRAILRNFVAKRRSTKKSPTWRKRNRRLGTLQPGNKKNRKLNLTVAIDTSGSVSDKELALFTGEIQKIYQNGADITVIECDAAVQNVYEYTKKLQKSGGMTFKGRGGTDFRPVFEHIMNPEKTKAKPDAVIFLTDGYGPAPNVFKIPTLWCLTPGGRRPYDERMNNEVQWGTVITLQD